MNNKQKWIIGIIIIILVGWLIAARRHTPIQETGTNAEVVAQEQIGNSDGTENTKPVSANSYSYQGEDGKTALELLKSNYSNVETESSSYGDFVTGINNVKADGTKEYWSFYVNGETANEGASTYVTKSSDTIEWRLELL